MSLTAEEILAELKSLGRETYRKTMLRHGASEPIYGVSGEDLKKIQKRIRKDYALALALFDTGVSDARCSSFLTRSFNAMIGYRVRVSTPEEVDTELIGWLKQAYAES